MSPNFRKHRDRLELFLDDGFSNSETASALRTQGFVVHEFVECFPREGDHSKREQSIKDPPIIELCSKNSWVLVTTDKEMCKTHCADIRRNRNATILATAHNGRCQPDEWIQWLVLLRPKLTQMLRDHERPWFAFFCREGKITAKRDLVFK